LIPWLFSLSVGISIFFLTLYRGVRRQERSVIESMLGLDVAVGKDGMTGKERSRGGILKVCRSFISNRLEEGGLAGSLVIHRGFAGSASLAVSMILLTIFLLKMPFPLAAAGIVVLMVMGKKVPRFLAKRKESKRLLAMAREIPEMVDLLAVLCLSGMSVQSAFRCLPECIQDPYLKEAVTGAVERLKLGESFSGSLEELKRHQLPDLRRVARVLDRAEEQGASVSELLDSLASEMKSRRRTRLRERAARASLAILFPLVFLILPSFLIFTLGGIILGFTQRGP